jgi:hypothetical protein
VGATMVEAKLKLYPYVGPEDIRKRAVGQHGLRVDAVSALVTWLRTTTPNPDGLIPVTFVVDEQGHLRVADRRSEHVACAGGGSVRSAGELFLLITEGVSVEEATISPPGTVLSRNPGWRSATH